MNTTVKTIIGIVPGIAIGSFVNGTIVSNCPVPEGADISTPEALKNTLHLYGFNDLIYPFFAHAMGTFVGAFVAAFIAYKKMVAAQVVSFMFFLGGLYMAFYLDFKPLEFSIIDLLFAYFPMGILGFLVAKKVSK